jgi:hypothetical protein
MIWRCGRRGLGLQLRRPRILLIPCLLLVFSLWWFGTKPGRRVKVLTTLTPSLGVPDFGVGSRPTNSNLTVNLVLATVAKDSIAWTRQLQSQIPSLRVIRYVSDDATATYRPPVPRKGREALIYHTYLHDFYDNLPDISIFIHADETPWHADPAIWGSMPFALSRLDLSHISRARDGYASLRLEWHQACPAWLDTTKSPQESLKQEEPFAAAVMRENFGLKEAEVPRVLAGPCCSQFVATRDAIRRRTKAEYAHMRDWLTNTQINDYITGRVWERMWPYLFRREASDCPREVEGYCAMFGVCFENADLYSVYSGLWKKRQHLLDHSGVSEFFTGPIDTLMKKWHIRQIGFILEDMMLVALERGKDQKLRWEAEGRLYPI